MVGISKDCFDHYESVKLIKILKYSLGCNLHSKDQTKTDWLRYDLSPKRPTLVFVMDKIIEPIREAERSGHFPVYIQLNIVATPKQEKHAIILVILRVRSSQQKYHVLLFDPNGHVDRHGEIYEQKIHQVLDCLKTRLHLVVNDLMTDQPAINTVGQGFCDALALYFVYLNVIHGNSSVKHFTEDLRAWLSSFYEDKPKQTSNVLSILRKVIASPASLSIPVLRQQQQRQQQSQTRQRRPSRRIITRT